MFIKGYFGGECGLEVLSFRGSDEEDTRGVSNSHLVKLNDKAQAQTVYDSNGLSCTLSANGGGQGGKTGLYLVPKRDVDE